MAILLHEWRPSAPIPLTPEQRDALMAVAAASIAIAPAQGIESGYILTPGSRVGAFSVGDLDFIIRPKLPMASVLYLVSYAIGKSQWLHHDFGFEEELSLVEVVIAGFSHQVERALRFGLLHGYRAQDDSLLTVRGRIRFDDQIRRRFGRFPPAEVSYDEFTDNVEENRLLRAACDRLGHLRLRSSRSAAELRAISARLASIPLVEYQRDRLPAIAYTRLNEHYRPAVELARLILRAAAFEQRHGSVRASAFLIDMNQVFEDFVVTAVREELHLSDGAFAHGIRSHLYLDAARDIELIPDMSWWEGGRCTFVGDVKYKRAGVQGAPNADLYQLLAYTIAAGVPAGLLVYAAGEVAEATYEIVQAGKRLVVTTLHVGGDPTTIRAQVSSLASRVGAMRRQALDEAPAA